jgi:Ca2+:H+ antiporter
VGEAGEHTDELSPAGKSTAKAVWLLLAATAGVAVMSELLVGAVQETARQFGMSEVFVGVILVALIGNAAEHSSAILMAGRNKMDAVITIAVGSSIQIALFVAPVLVLLSYLIAPRPMDLRFTTFEVVAVGIAVWIISLVGQDGESHWMEGVQLLAVYAILALAFYWLPG